MNQNREAFAEQHPQLVTECTWRVPDGIEIANGQLVEPPWHTDTVTTKAPRHGLLGQFVRLHVASEAAVHAFARSYGLLRLCALHRWPAGHANTCSEPWIVNRAGGGYVDDVADWRRWSRRFLGTIGMAQSVLRDRGPLQAEDVEDALEALPSLEGGQNWGAWVDRLRRPPRPAGKLYVRDDPSATYVPYEPAPWKPPRSIVQAHALQMWLNTLLRAAGVGRQVRFDPKGTVLELRDGVNDDCPLFGVLTMELAGACAGLTTQARCKSCRKGFNARTRRERYCAACRRNGAPLRIAQQKLRDDLRAQGLSSRGRPLGKTRRK